MAEVILLLAGVAVLAGMAWWLTHRTTASADEEAPGEPEWCGECGEYLADDEPRCKVVQQFTDPDGSGWGMTAYFHPGCCPVDDPEHVHAGAGRGA